MPCEMHVHRRSGSNPLQNHAELDCTQGVLLPWLITAKTRLPVCDRQQTIQEKQNQCQWEPPRGILLPTETNSMNDCRQRLFTRHPSETGAKNVAKVPPDGDEVSFDGKEGAEVSIKIS